MNMESGVTFNRESALNYFLSISFNVVAPSAIEPTEHD